MEEELLARVAKDARFAADAIHVLVRKELPGGVENNEALVELEYAGELMVVQFLNLIRTFLAPETKK